MRQLITALVILATAQIASAQQRIVLSSGYHGDGVYPEFVMGSIREARFTHVIATMMLNGHPHPGYPRPIEVWSAPLPQDFIAWSWAEQFKCELLIDEGILAELPISRLSCQRLFALIVHGNYPAMQPLKWMLPSRAIAAEIGYGGLNACRVNIGVEPHGVSIMFDQPSDITASVCRTLMRGIWLDAGRKP